MPKQYEKPDEETDEVEVFFDEDLVHCDPEYLPRKLLTDFAIYNTEVRVVGWRGFVEERWRGCGGVVERVCGYRDLGDGHGDTKA